MIIQVCTSVVLFVYTSKSNVPRDFIGDKYEYLRLISNTPRNV